MRVPSECVHMHCDAAFLLLVRGRSRYVSDGVASSIEYNYFVFALVSGFDKASGRRNMPCSNVQV
jgi:hypothetical protein